MWLRGRRRVAGAGRPAVGLWLRGHGLFLVLLVCGCGLRVLAMLGFRPILMPPGDPYRYLADAVRLAPGWFRPSGYSFLLRALEPFHSLALIAAVQHLLSVGVGIGVYALARRWLVPGWGAALAAAPSLLDGYQIELEHLLLSDTLFIALVVAATVILMWSVRPGPIATAAAGVLLAWAAVTRPIGLPLFVLAAAYVIVVHARWQAVLALLAACATPLVGYAMWFHASYGRYELTGSGGMYLWARTMAFADCAKMQPVGRQRLLCSTTPPKDRVPSGLMLWVPWSPVASLPSPQFTAANDRLAQDFAIRAITHQPGEYLSTVLCQVGWAFRWNRPTYPAPIIMHNYTYDITPGEYPFTNPRDPVSRVVATYTRQPAQPHTVVQPYADLTRTYQRYVFVPGTLLAALLILGLPSLIADRRCWFPWLTGLALIIEPIATADFDYRYILPILPFAGLTAAFGVTTLHHHKTRNRATRQGV